MTPTQRSKRYLEEDGYTVSIAEHWNGFAKKRFDLFGFIDIVCLQPGCILGVQTTSGPNAAARVKKILGLKSALSWARAGGKILVLSWSKKGPRGKRKTWTATEKWIGIDDFGGA